MAIVEDVVIPSYNEVDEYDNSNIWTEIRCGLKGEVFIEDEADVARRDAVKQRTVI